jgi:hypothetical protein
MTIPLAHHNAPTPQQFLYLRWLPQGRGKVESRKEEASKVESRKEEVEMTEKSGR